MSTQLQVVGIGSPSVVISPAAYEAKRVALQLAAAVTEVTDLASQTAAAQALATVKGLADQVEQSRKIVKDPVLKIGKEIDSTASTFTTELTIEARRLSLLVGNFQDAERRKAQQAAEETRKAEQQRIEQQKAEERARAGQEVKGRTGTLSQDLQQIQTRAAADVAQIRQAGINAAVAAPTGATIRKSWKFEVTDVQALFKSNPTLCTIEPNNAAIRAVIAHNQAIPGLRVWSETAAIVTAKAPTAVPATVESFDY